MKLTRLILGIGLLINGFAAMAQIIEEDNTEILDAARGEALFTLSAEVKVYSFEPEEGWYKIRRQVWVSPENMDGKTLKAGSVLHDENKKVIGKAIKDVKVKEGETAEAFRGEKRFKAIIEGWVFKTKIKNGTVPEEQVAKILALKNRNEQMAALEELYGIYEFEKRVFEDLTARVYREENKSLAEEKDFRIILLLRGETTPYAVITNDHDGLTAPKIKMETQDPPFRVIYFYKPPAQQKELVENKILYTFLGL